jgi:LuxR family maltose regulon positive regulatory protein
MLEDAARHALSSGQTGRAYEWAERSLYESITVRGRQGAVLEWLKLLPQAELDHRPRMLLAAAWSLALSERHEEAGRLVARILAQHPDDALRCECALILSGAAVFAEPRPLCRVHDPGRRRRCPAIVLPQIPPTTASALLGGEPALAPAPAEQPRGDRRRLGLRRRWGEFITGLTYVGSQIP